jgi:hypothetical protein
MTIVSTPPIEKVSNNKLLYHNVHECNYTRPLLQLASSSDASSSHGATTAAYWLFSSSSSMVSDMFLPLVSGRQTTKRPRQPMQSPNTPNDQKLLSRPSATSTGATTPPSTSAWRTSPTAELRTDVGNSSME